MDYCIRKLLKLTEENFIPDEHWLEIKHENHQEIYIIKGKWDKDCKCCPHYRNKNIIKHIATIRIIKLPMLRFKHQSKNVQYYSFNTSFKR